MRGGREAGDLVRPAAWGRSRAGASAGRPFRLEEQGRRGDKFLAKRPASAYTIPPENEDPAMRELIRLISSAGTGYFYVTDKNKRTMTQKLKIKKYDPRARKHVEFTEAKMK